MAIVKGTERYIRHLTKIGPNTRSLIGKVLFVAGGIIEAEAEISITAGSVSGKMHKPSAPGQPPNADTRQLDNSIETIKKGELSVDVVSKAPYSAALEYGTENNHPAARPFMRPATDKSRAEITNLIVKAARKGAE
ncbi:MAG TPA: HK97-gp10 family putative phage morphogenesis protein [Reyranella sp.]|nr:HK97-gp10 family putative phage morphogenesis protein [Reyranella sp.]